MEQLLLQNENENNERVANIFLGLSGFIIVIWLLNVMGVFDVNIVTISVFTVIMVGLMVLPAILIRVVRLRKPAVKYLMIAEIALVVGISYLFFTFQMVIMFLLPVLVALLYMNKKVMWFAEIASMVSLIASHMISIAFVAMPWLEVFTDATDIMRFNLLPRMCQLIACFIVVSFLLNRMIGYFSQYDRIVNEQDDAELPELDELEKALALLTESERSVFLELVNGKTNTQIADKMSFSPGTVKNYVSSIYDKLECRERSYLILKYSAAVKTYDQSHMNL